MRKKYAERTIRIVGTCWVLFPVLYIFYGLLFLGLNTEGLLKMVLSPWYWFVSALAILAGIGILQILWFGWYAFLFSNFTIAYQTAVALIYYSVADIRIPAFFGTLVMQVLLIYLVGLKIRVPYFFPRIRWWESDPRFKLNIPAQLRLNDQSESSDGDILDLSLKGCFIKTFVDHQQDEDLKINFVLFEKEITCTGKVVWVTEGAVTHPRGIGVKFDPLNKEAVFYIKKAVRKIKHLARFYTQLNRERNWREYLEREKNYQDKKKYLK